MRIAFLGTPEFAVPSLQKLIDRKDELMVFTQPDRPVGRKAVLTPPPVKLLAQSYGIPVFQTEKIRSDEGVAALQSFAPDAVVTAAFGQLLSAKNLSIPRLGTINVHASLLPKYRGASPIQAAILNGDAMTGVTTMFTDIGMDTGDILLQRTAEISITDTYETLSQRLSHIGAGLLGDTLELLQSGCLCRIPQNNDEATTCHMIKKDDGRLCFDHSAFAVYNRIRAFNPWPAAYAFLEGQQLKIWQAALTGIESSALPNGTLQVIDRKLYVRCGDGMLEIVALQLPGKKKLSSEQFILGYPVDGKQLL